MMHCARDLNFTFHPLSSMHRELFVDSFAAYVKHAPFMRMVHDCMLTYRSPDHDLTVSMPVRPALRGSHINMQASHPSYTTFTAMHHRTSNPQRSHHNVEVEPGWTGCFWPGVYASIWINVCILFICDMLIPCPVH